MRIWWVTAFSIACDGGGSRVACEDVAERTLMACGSSGNQILLPSGSSLLDDCTRVLGSVHMPDGTAEQLAQIGGVIRIDEKLSIFRGAHTDLEPLSGLRFVGGELSVRLTDELVELDGLEGVCELGALTLQANSALEDLAGLASLRRVHGDVLIDDNRRLPASEIAALLARIEVGGTVTVADNGD